MPPKDRTPRKMQQPIDVIQGAGLPFAQTVLALLRGGRMESQEEIHERSRRFLQDPYCVPLGSVYLPEQALFEMLAFIGSSGSGKSVGINQVKRNRLCHVGRGHGHRALIWSYKGNERLYLESLDLRCPVYYINPLDVRGVGIDLAAELDGPLEADGFAADVISPLSGKVDGEDGSTFQMASQAIFAEVIKAFQQEAPGEWRLIDVLEACRSEANLRRVLPMTIDGEAMVEDLLGANKQAKGIMLTLRANFNRLLPLAAAMSHSQNISLREWVQDEESVLVLQNVDKYEANLAPFFRWVFKHTLSLVMSREVDRGETYTFFVDEARRAPFAEELVKLATEGREYRAGAVFGFQDVQGLKNVLGPDGVGELISCCSTQVYFQNNNPETARFAADRFGTQLLLTAEHSASFGRNQNTNAPNLDAREKDRIVRSYLTKREWDEWGHRGAAGTPGPGHYYQRRRSMRGENELPGHHIDAYLYDQHGIFPNGSPISESDTDSETLSTTVRPAEYPMVYPSEVLHLPKPDPFTETGEGLTTHAYIASTFLGNWREVAHEMQEATLVKDRTVPIFRPRPAKQLRYLGWTEDDEERLGILAVQD